MTELKVSKQAVERYQQNHAMGFIPVGPIWFNLDVGTVSNIHFTGAHLDDIKPEPDLDLTGIYKLIDDAIQHFVYTGKTTLN